MALVVGAIGLALPATSAAATDPIPLVLTPTTVVTIGFDDGTADQFAALQELQLHGMHATFFINSGFIGDPDHMSVSQLQQLQAAGNEIGGHTIDHANIQPLPPAEAMREVCDDRAQLAGVEPHGHVLRVPVRVVGRERRGDRPGMRLRQRSDGVGGLDPRREGQDRRDDPAGRSVRDPHTAEPEEGDQAHDDGAVRD